MRFLRQTLLLAFLCIGGTASAQLALPDNKSTPEEVAIEVDVLDNDLGGFFDPIDATTVDLDPSDVAIQQSLTVSSGEFSVNAVNGRITFTPLLNFVGSVIQPYTFSTQSGSRPAGANLNITVTQVNDAPVAQDDLGTTAEETSTTINVVSNDSDIEGGLKPSSVDLNTSSPNIQTSNATTAGNWTVNPSGVVSFTPATNFNGSATLTYTVNDVDNAVSNIATITISVTPVNDAPTAVADNASGNEDTAISVVVTANDSDVDGSINPASVDLNTASGGIQNTNITAEGSWAVDAVGKVTLTPTTNFSGTATLSYFVGDNGVPAPILTSNSALITITVTAQNDAPLAVNDALVINEDTPGNVNILTNDTDSEGNGTIRPLTVDVDLSQPGKQKTIAINGGDVSVTNAGLLAFTPSPNFFGSTSLTYTVDDDQGATSNVATVNITVNAVNDPPKANPDNISAEENGSITLNIVQNDTDADGTVVASTVDIDPASPGQQVSLNTAAGSWSVNNAGVVSYIASLNFNGSAVISYQVRDDANALSNTATVTILVNNTNDPPSFDQIANQRSLRNGAQRTITITGISAGPGETENMVLTASSSNGALIANPVISYSSPASTATLTYTPAPNQTGTATITVNLIDSKPNVVTQTFTVEVVDIAFTSSPVTLAVEGEPYEYVVQITDVSDPVSIVGAQIPAWATLTQISNTQAVLSGTPPANSAPSETVVLQIADGASVVREQSFTLVVNHRPVVSAFAVNINEDEAIAYTASQFTSAYSDPDGSPLTEVQFTALPAHGFILLNGSVIAVNTKVPIASINSVVYRPAANYFGKDTLYWSGSDGLNYSMASAYINYEIAPVNDAPTVTLENPTDSLQYELSSGLSVKLTTVAQVIDVDGDNITGAEIAFRSTNFDGLHDRLLFTPTAAITGVYNATAGKLTLTGEASATEYTNVIRSILYTYANFEDIDLGGRSVGFTLNDGKSIGTTEYRNIKLIYTFEDIRIPNAFTPNGDGTHDVWRIGAKDGDVLTQYDNAELKVYDKRGKLLFEAVGLDKPWDGKHNGELLPSDSYFYTIDLKYNKVLYKGSITILR